MHTLNIFNGGYRPKGSDLSTLQNAYKEGLKSIFKAFGENYIIYGCEVVVSGSNYDISEGAICVEGEYYLVPAHVIPIVSGNIYFWEIIVQNITASAVVYENGVSHYSLTERYIQLNSSASPSIGYIPQVLPTMIELTNGKWILIDTTSVLTFFTIPSVTCSLIYSGPLQADRQNRMWYRIVGDTLEFFGSFYVSMSSGTVTNVSSCEILFPNSAMAHINADVLAVGVQGFVGTLYENAVIELNTARNGVTIFWDTPVPISNNLYIRVPNITVKLT